MSDYYEEALEKIIKNLEIENKKLAHKLEIALEGLSIIAEHGDTGNISTKTLEAVKEQ